MASARRGPIPIVASAVIAISAWQLVYVLADLPTYMLPAPADVVIALVAGVSEPLDSRESMLAHLFHTLRAALIGFVIGSVVGISGGAACALSSIANRLIKPYVFALQSMPKIALTPLLMIWLGFGDGTKITLAALLVFFPMFVNTYTGLVNVDQSYFRLFDALGASRWQTLRELQLPSALVAIFAGFEMAIVRAQLGAVVAEFLAGQDGVGILLIRYQYSNNSAGVFAIFLLLAATSIALYQTIRWTKKRVIFWAPATNQ